jgi:hypothetical protein
LTVAPLAAAQRARRKSAPPPKDQAASQKQIDLAKEAAQSRANLIATTKAYQGSLEKLLALQVEEEKRAAELVQKRRALLELGVIAKRELEESQTAIEEARGKTETTRQRMREADQLLAEVAAAEYLARLPVEPPGAYRATLLLIRYTGFNRWSLTEVARVDAFFRGRFGRPLPVSAFGQTETHTRLGFDHREGLDVAVHPDGLEGQALIEYLRGQGIPFIAFRSAFPGSATGAHIHIGRPSNRVVAPIS